MTSKRGTAPIHHAPPVPEPGTESGTGHQQLAQGETAAQVLEKEQPEHVLVSFPPFLEEAVSSGAFRLPQMTLKPTYGS